MAGRKRIPDHLKIVAGTAQPCRMNADAPVAASDLLVPPEWLSARSAEIFAGLVSVIEGMGIAWASDTAALALAACRPAEVEGCAAGIEDGGRTCLSSAGYDSEGRVISQQLKGHPAVAQRSEAMRHGQALLAEFGLTPAARAKVSVNRKPEAN